MPSRQSIVEHVHQLVSRKELAVLWASHLIDEIYPSDQLVILDKGIVKAQGGVDKVQKATQTTSVHDAFYQLTQAGMAK